MLNETAYVNTPSNAKVGLIDYTTSDFWTLSAGVSNTIMVTGQATTSQTAAVITFHDSYI
jgi:hypothetical protein